MLKALALAVLVGNIALALAAARPVVAKPGVKTGVQRPEGCSYEQCH